MIQTSVEVIEKKCELQCECQNNEASGKYDHISEHFARFKQPCEDNVECMVI